MTSEDEYEASESDDSEEKKDEPMEFSEKHSRHTKSESGNKKTIKEGYSMIKVPFRQNTDYEQQLLAIAS